MKLARNSKFPKVIRYNMQYIPCNSALSKLFGKGCSRLRNFCRPVQNCCRTTYLCNLETFSFLALSQHWSERWERWGPRRENGGFWWRQNKNRQRLAVITGGWVKDGGAVQETDEQPGSLYSFVFYFLYLYLNSYLCFFVFEARHYVFWIMWTCLLICTLYFYYQKAYMS